MISLYLPFLQIIMPDGVNEKLLNYEISGIFIIFLILLVGLYFRNNTAANNKILLLMEKRIQENNTARDEHRAVSERTLGDMQNIIMKQQEEILTLQRQSDMMGAELRSCHVTLSDKISEITTLNTELTKQMAEVSKLLKVINTEKNSK